MRTLGISILVALAAIASIAYVAAHWVERQVLTTDNWVALVSPLPGNPTVSTALGAHISDQVFDSADVERRVTDALPPQAAFLAGPLTDQLHNLATSAAQRLVASDGFQSVWTAANRIAMDRLVATARGQPTPLQQRVEQKFNLDLSGASGQLSAALGKASAAIPALQPATTKTIGISTDLKARGDRIRAAIRTTDYLAAVLPWFITACVLGALALSTDRRRTGMVLAVSVIVGMLLALVAIKWSRQELLDQVRHAQNVPAISYIFDTLTGWLRRMVLVVITAMLAVLGLCLAAGPYAWARSLRQRLHLMQLQDSRPLAVWHSFRRNIYRWRYYAWLAIVILVLAGTALLPAVSRQALTNALLLALSLVALVQIIATPHHHGQPVAEEHMPSGVTA